MHILTHTLTFMHHLECIYARICMHHFTHTYTPHIHTNMQASLRTHINTPVHLYLKTCISIHTHTRRCSQNIHKRNHIQKATVSKNNKRKKSSRRCCYVCLYNTGLFLSFVRVTEPFVSGTRDISRPESQSTAGRGSET